ncbi:MAG: AI-2E family transporter [Candidatus Pacebacteria bacterium]|nr:AI-2E family transporter [Candidatus Paceibacterota bacterium]
MDNQKIKVNISYESIIKFFIVLFVLLFFVHLRGIIFVVFISMILALIMNPAVDKMQKKKIPRVAGAASLFLSAFVLIGILIYIVAPPLAKEVGTLSSNFPMYLENAGLDYSMISSQDITIDGSFDYKISEPFQNILFEASKVLKDMTSNIVVGILGFLGGILTVILIFVISFYLVVEKNGVEKFVRTLIPAEFRPQALRVINKIEIKLGKWFMGQLFLGLIVGLLSFVGLTILGVPYALVLAIIAGSMELIPYIGPTLSSIPAIIIAFTISPLLAVLVFALYFIIQQLENYLIVPKVMEKSVGLHPVVIIIAMLIGGQVAGVLGIILAIPVTTITSIILEDIYTHKEEAD